MTVAPLQLAVKLGMYASDAPLAARFDELAGLGLNGVEVGVDERSNLGELAAASESSGLRIPTVIANHTFDHSLTSPNLQERAAAADVVVRSIAAAHAIGAEVVMLSPGWDRAELPPERTAALVRDALAPALRDAAQAGVTIAIENLWNGWLSSATDLAHFIDSFESNSVRVLFDTGNAARFTAPQHWIQVLGSRIVRVDLKDYANGWSRKPAELYAQDDELQAVWGVGGPWGALDSLLFEGDVNFEVVAGALSESGYEGWVCAEHGAGGRDWIARFVADLTHFSELFTMKGQPQ
jgi:hexulose-6-phosphate isomerase